MAKTRRAYTGGAVSTTTTSSIAASGTTSFTITAGTGWPYGSDPFYIVVEPGTASEEKILVTRTGVSDTTLNIASDSVRGLDGTAAVSHGSGVTTFPVFTAVDADEANELTSKWSAKGDLVSYGTSTFEKLAVGTNGQFLRAASGEASGLKWETFNNTLGSGSAVRTLGSFVGGDVLQAAELNNIGNFTSYTPTFTNMTVSSSSFEYARVNDLVVLRIYAVVSTMGSFPNFTVPSGLNISRSPNFQRVGLLESGVAWWDGLVLFESATQLGLFCLNTSTTYGQYAGLSSAAPFNWGAGDAIDGMIVYGV
jgi:hypothetical protein